MFGENFPYTNFHELNMDWIIKIAKDFLDQYSHIQEMIASGEESLSNMTTDGINQLQEKATELEGLLEQWYDTHSDDIADALATALDDLNAQLATNIIAFNQQAAQKGQEVIESIPSDYSALSQKVQNLIDGNAFDVLPKLTGSHTDNGVTFDWGADGSCLVHGTQSGGSSATENIYYNETAMPSGFIPGETYYVDFSSSSNMRLQVLGYKSGGSYEVLYGEAGTGSRPTTFTIPSDTIGMFIRLLVVANAVVNETVTPIIRNALTNKALSFNQEDLRPAITAIQGDVAELKIHELNMNFSNTTNLNTASMWEQGSISQVTGLNVVSSGRIRTVGTLPTNVSATILTNKARGFFILGYNVDGTYIGAYKSDGTFSLNDDGTGYDEFNFSSIYEKYNNIRIRLYLYSRDGEPITLDEADTIVMQNIYNQIINPVTIRVMDYNIGGFNFGHDGGYSGDQLGLKLSNYRNLLNEYKPNIVCLQEYRPYVDSGNTFSPDYIIFNYELPYKTFDPDSYPQYPYVSFMDYLPTNTRHIYLHTSGDYPVHLVYNNVVINNTQIVIGTCALNPLGGTDDAVMKIRALTKMVNVLSGYETAIIGIDTNVISEAEANAVKAFMKSNGYAVANWDYIGYIPTYNPASQIYKCIDNIFIKGKAKFKHVEVVPTSKYNDLLSDHLPIIADILIYK